MAQPRYTPPRPHYHSLLPRNRSTGHTTRTGQLCLTEQMVYAESAILRYALLYKFTHYPNARQRPELVLVQTTSGIITLHEFMTLGAVTTDPSEPFYKHNTSWQYERKRRWIPTICDVLGSTTQRKLRLEAHERAALLLGSASAAAYQLAHQIFAARRCWANTDLYSIVTLNNPRFLSPGQSEDGTPED